MSKRLHVSTPVAVVAVLNATPDRLVALIHAGESIRNRSGPCCEWRRAAVSSHVARRAWRTDQRWGRRSSQQRATRILSAAGLPGVCRSNHRTRGPDEGLLAARRMYFAAALGGVVLLVCAACYAIARGVLREAAAGRLQSDFVSAVSHEFRTPLTTLRQLTECWRTGASRTKDGGGSASTFCRKRRRDCISWWRICSTSDAWTRADVSAVSSRSISALVREGIEEYRRESGNGHRIELTSNPRRSSSMPIARRSPSDSEPARERRQSIRPIRRPSGWKPSMTACGGAARARPGHRHSAGGARAHLRQVRSRRRAKRACIQGTGIGLAMVKEIVEVHRGDVRLSSDVGRGSTFMVRLPLSSAASESVV